MKEEIVEGRGGIQMENSIAIYPYMPEGKRESERYTHMHKLEIFSFYHIKKPWKYCKSKYVGADSLTYYASTYLGIGIT